MTGLRARLITLILLVLLPAGGLLLHTAAEQRRMAERAIAESGLQLLRTTSGEYERLLGSTRNLLVLLSRLPVVRQGDPTAAGIMFALLIQDDPGLANLGLATPQGRLVASGLPLSRPLDLSGWPYFRRAVRQKNFSVGEFQPGHLAPGPTLNVAYPVLAPDGEVEGVVFAALDLDWLQTRTAQAQLPPGAVLTLVDRAGVVLAQHPIADGIVGHRLRNVELRQAILQTHAGVRRGRDAEGTERLYVFRPLDRGGDPPSTYLLIGLPRALAYAEADRELAQNFALLAAVALLTILAGWFGTEYLVLRPIQVLVRTANELGRGRLEARSGLEHTTGELGQLARAFDTMAASLEIARQRALDAEAEKTSFHREALRAFTHGKFLLADRAELQPEGRLLLDIALDHPDAYPRLRRELAQAVRAAGMSEERAEELVLAVGEAVGNALKHAVGGRCRIYRTGDCFLARVEDQGSGIRPENLPASILQPGFSTQVSLGMGYTLMLELSDEVALATGPEGTVVQLRKCLQPLAETSLADALARF